MILMLGGTKESRTAAVALVQAGWRVFLTSATSHFVMAPMPGLEVRSGELSQEELRQLACCSETVVDATHPFATRISEMAIAVCREVGVPYVRLERPGIALPNVHLADGHAEAARLALELAGGRTILLTIGSRNLAPYVTAARERSARLVARVLPVSESIVACTAAGLAAAEIVAMQGPVTSNLEQAFLKHFEAGVLVSKDSGEEGGLEAKMSAAAELGIPMVVIRRPPLAYPRLVSTVPELLECVKSLLKN